MDDDDDWQNCNLSKLKLEKEANEFQFLLNECKKWIETISGKQFLYDNDFRKSLENGVILCELLNVLKRDCIKRINRHSTPIAGIDNLNLFLKACQQHFSISQTHLFDPTDLEDLSIRALNNSVVSIDEQNRRLKKVVYTIYWLSRKTNELGIPIDYYLDQTTLFSSSSLSNTHHHNHHLTHKYTSSTSSSSVLSSSTNNCGVVITSLLSTSTINSNSFCSNSSDHSSETSGYNSLSKLNNTTNNTNNNNHNNNNSNNNIANQISNNNKLVGHHSRESSADSLNLLSFQSSTSTTTTSNITINNNNNNNNTNTNNTDNNNYDQSDRIMSYIYKQPITQSSQNNNKTTTTTSSPLYDTSRSYNNNNNNNKLRTNSGTLLLNTSNNNTNNENIITRKDSVETLDSLSSSNSIKNNNINNNNNQMKLNQNNSSTTAHTNLLSYNLGSQDELDNLLLNNNLPSPSSGVTSPSMLSYLSTSSNNINNISSTTTATATTTTTNTNTTVIPTRFTDRRVSSSAIQDPYKFNVNISEAGSRLARAAQEQLKISEKIKEAKKEIHTTNLNISSNSSTNGQLSARTITATTTSINGNSTKQRKNSMNNDGEGLGEDWQNSVDDWKKRRKEKQKEKVNSVDTPTTPTTTTTTTPSFKTQLSYEAPSTVKQNNTSSSVNNNNNNISNKINIPTNRSHDHTSTKANNNSNFQQLKSKFNGNDDYEDDDDDDYKQLSSSPTKHTNPVQQQMSPKHQINQHYVQKLIKISRAHSYATRGFGFLINNVTTSNGKKCAQVVIVEPDSLAAKAGLEKNDQVIEINKQLTSDLTDEQLRKIIRERLQQNSVDLLILRAVNENEFQQQNNTEIINHNNNNINNNDKGLFDSTDSLYSKIQPLAPSTTTTTQPPSIPATPPPPVPTTTTTTPTQSFSNQNNSSTNPPMTNGHSNSQSSLHKYFAPKPFRKSLPNDLQHTTTTTTYHSTQNQNDNESSSVTPTQELNDMNNNNNNKTNNNNNNNLYENSYSNETYQPPLPSSEPPPLPSSEPPSIKKNDPQESAINRALFDNIKIVDNWKVEQDLLLKKIYEEEQKRIDDLFKLNLEKVKEEETKRREEEKLKLEKEKLRLQDLEIKQRERQLQEKLRQQEEFKATSTLVADALQKKDLKSIIEKVYDQTDDKIEFDSLRTSRSDIASVRRIFENEKQNSPVGKRQPSPSQQHPINGDVHQVIRKVHDSMDNLCNELLQKDMPSYAKDVHVMNQNLESARRKQEEVDRIKREQEMLQHEKERIEYEKEKLKKEAESLRQERELIILAASKKQQLFNDDSTNKIKTNNKHERQYSNEQDPGYGTMTELDYYKNSSFDENENILSKSTPSYSINNNKIQMDKNQRNKFGFSSAYNSPSSSLYNPNTSSNFQPQPSVPNYSLSSPLKPSPITASTARKSAINKLSQAPRSKIFDVPNWGPSNKIQNFPMSHSYGNVNHWASEEAEKLRVAEQNYLQRPQQLVNTSQTNLRRSFPNILESTNTFTSKSQSNINTSPTINNSTIKFNSPNSNRLTTSQHELYSPNKQAYSNLAYDTLRQSVPTIPLHDQLRHGYKDTFNQPKQHQQQQQQKPVRSLSSLQKCANCSNEIGQSPAMVIEKLNLAYHLKCFRCSVCNITLSNGKEGTDVRVRGNKLHCNNCFSNEQGIKLSAV